jgi:probable phosphoglycerate mutase
VWVPREHNTRADALANAAMNGRPAPEVELAPPAPAAAPRSWAPPSQVATRLLLVRHGETAMTAQGRYSGRADVPLSDRGVAQARAVGGRVAVLAPSVAAVVSSPLTRCVATAEEIAAAVGVAGVRREPDLIECDFGEWDGLAFHEVRQRWPEEMTRWLSSSHVAPPGGESFERVAERARRITTQLLTEYSGQTIVVVSHVSPIKLLLRDALLGGDGFLHRLYLDPAGLSLVDHWPDGQVAVRAVNDTAHLA